MNDCCGPFCGPLQNPAYRSTLARFVIMTGHSHTSGQLDSDSPTHLIRYFQIKRHDAAQNYPTIYFAGLLGVSWR